MKKVIVFLVPILFLFSCTKPYNPQDYIGTEFDFWGVWKTKADGSFWNRETGKVDQYSSTLIINFDKGTYEYSHKGYNNDYTAKGNGIINDVSFKSGENDYDYMKLLSYKLNGVEYSHKIAIYGDNGQNALKVWVEPKKYGIFGLLYHKGNEQKSSLSFLLRR